MGHNRLLKPPCVYANAPVARQSPGPEIADRPWAKQTSARNGVAWRLVRLVALVVPLWGVAADRALADDCADVDLVLAIDGSGSIDSYEFPLQQMGYSSAFRRRDVQDALNAAGTVDVAVVLWGDSEMDAQVLPWMRVIDGQSAELLAARLDSLVRRVQGDTGIGRGLSLALDLLEMPGRCGLRKIVNVSGDGHESVSPRARHHIPLSHAKKRADEMGVVVNALAIENEVPDLADWYSQRLIVGPGAFVMRVDGFGTFADAIAAKLIREIRLPDVALDREGRTLPPPDAEPPRREAEQKT